MAASALEKAGDAAHQAAAANGYEDGVQLRLLVQQLDGDGALTGDDVLVVVGGDEGLVALPGGGAGADFGVEGVAGYAAERDREGLKLLYFAGRSPFREKDGGGDIELGGGAGYGEGVVAGGGGDDAAGALFG